eukprot:Gb_17646 [translate_table: standard]
MMWKSLAKLLSLSVGIAAFVLFIAVDARRALKKNEHWIPANTLVLSALSIQLLTVLNGQTSELEQTYNVIRNGAEDDDQLWGDSIRTNMLVIHSGRVMMCVFIGYLLPGMARPRTRGWRSKLAALILSIVFQISSEFYSLYHRSNDKNNNRSINLYLVSITTIFVSITVLLLLLWCAAFASKSIQDIVKQKIPVILRRDSNVVTWEGVEEEVLKSWIVARACQPEYIIARSVLSSSAGWVVTVCILISVVPWAYAGSTERYNDDLDWLMLTAFGLKCVFILTGWLIICWRWFTAVFYYGYSGSFLRRMRRWFHMEDFWTRRIFELGDEAFNPKAGIITKMGLRLPFKIPVVLVMVQIVVVFFSKGCWFFSEMFFCNKRVRRWFMSPDQYNLLLLYEEGSVKSDSDFRKYLGALKQIHMPGENPASLWVANGKGFKQAKKRLNKGFNDGQNCHELITLLRHKTSRNRTGGRCLDPKSYPEMDFKYLCKLDPEILHVETQFNYLGKRSCKLTAVSLISVIIQLYPLCVDNIDRNCQVIARNAIRAYSQAWEIMDLLDNSEPEALLLSQAADTAFQTLRVKARKRHPRIRKSDHKGTTKDAYAQIQKLAEEAKQRADIVGPTHDSVDWKAVAAANSLYKMCKSIHCTAPCDAKELVDEIECSLADVIDNCMQNVSTNLLVHNCIEWAGKLHEKEIWKALYIAGKVKGLKQKLEGESTNV